MKKHWSLLIILALLLAASSVQAAGLTYYVRSDGHDANCNGLYDAPEAGNAPNCAKQTLQAAIGAAGTGDTVNLAAGTFVESGQILIDKDLTITGAGVGLTVLNKAEDTGGPSSGTGRAWILVDDTGSLLLSDLTLDGAGRKIAIGVMAYSPTVIQDVAIKNIAWTSGQPDYYGRGVVFYGGSGHQVIDTSLENIGRIGLFAFGAGVDVQVSGLTYIGKGDGDWLDYGLEVGGGAAATLEDSTISDCRGVAASDGSTSAGMLVTTYFGGGSQATVTGSTFQDNTTGIAVGYDASDTSSVVAHQNSFIGNDYGISSTAPLVDAEYNWWGDPSGPYDATGSAETPPCTSDPLTEANADGTGDEVSDDVNYCPWLGASQAELQELFDTSCGGTVELDPAFYPGGLTLSCGLTVRGSPGATFLSGSPAFTITGDDVVLEGLTLDGGGSPDPGILVQTGADNFTLKDSEVHGFADGVLVAGPVTSLKIVSNFIHDNSDAGLRVDSAVAGILTVEGNLFKANGGDGVTYNGTGFLDAEYNSWGDLGGPNAPTGDGANPASVDFDPWTFAEFYMDVDPDAEALQVDVMELETFDVKLKLDAAKLYGMSFKFTYDPSLLTLNSATFASPWLGKCASLPSLPGGTVGYRCYLQAPGDVEYDADGGEVATFNFTANGSGLTGNGPWAAYLDIDHPVGGTSAGAKGGVKVFINNAGFGDPSQAERDLTDSDDGRIDITGMAQYTGFVDLQGKYDDSEVSILVYHQAAKAGSTLLASAESNASGQYTTAYTSANHLAVGSTYWFQVDAWLYLPTTPVDVLVTEWASSKLLDTRPMTTLGPVFLLGGDANNNDEIEINDATCIGGDYGKTSGFTVCGVDGISDVNSDSSIDILDLVLMGGNYELDYSPWTP